MKTPRLELVSFPLCPYVQRSLITLKTKEVPFSLKLIDLEAPPEWFKKLSPLGKVPVLIVDEQTVLFESAVINEYIDEITEPRLMPTDPLLKAQERAWIEFGSELLSQYFGLSMESDLVPYDEGKTELFNLLNRLEETLREGPYFRGKEFSLVDSSFAPLFARLALTPGITQDARYLKLQKIQKWSQNLLSLPSVRSTLPEDFSDQFKEFLTENNSLALKAPA